MDLARPTLRAHFRAEVMDERHVLLLAETGDHVLTGEVYARLVPLLDGTRSLDDLVRETRGGTPAAEVYYAVDRLAARGYVREAAPGMAPATQAFWDAMGADPAAAAARLEGATVSVATLGSPHAAAVRAALAALGVRVGGRGTADLAVVLVDDYLNPGLAAVNRRAARRGQPWLVARPAGLMPWIGPLFVPGETACWQCLAHRLEGNRAVAGLVRRSRGLDAPVFPPARRSRPPRARWRTWWRRRRRAGWRWGAATRSPARSPCSTRSAWLSRTTPCAGGRSAPRAARPAASPSQWCCGRAPPATRASRGTAARPRPRRWSACRTW